MKGKKGEIDREKNNKKKIIIILSVITVMILIGSLSLLFVPKIKLNGKKHIILKLNQSYKESGAVATVSGIDVSDKISVKGSVDVNKPGKYKIEYSIKKGLFNEKKQEL